MPICAIKRDNTLDLSLRSLMSSITVTVPATTANLGPGFDCIGAAFSLYNQFKFTTLDLETEPSIVVTGSEAARVDTSTNNLAYQSFLTLYQQLGKTPPTVQIEINLGVPLARGLGSSATAIVGGLVGANQLAGKPFSQFDLVQKAIALEGHPDNVVPALLGGCRLAANSNGWVICDVPWHSEVVPVVAIPDFELSTQEARSVLPAHYSRADAIFNVSHLGLLLRGLETGCKDWIQAAMQDRIHQPYRKALIKGFDRVHTAALQAGAYELAISGAGPTLLALVHPSQATAVEQAIATAWQAEGIVASVRSLSLDTQGAIVHS